MIECYVGACEYHISHTFGPDEGPFCTQERCQKSSEEVILLMQQAHKDEHMSITNVDD